MKLLVLSDLHLEFAALEVPATDADVVVLAGDVHVGPAGVAWAQETFPGTPVVYVLGNHEYYGQLFHKLALEMAALAKGSNIHVLERGGVLIDGVQFLGCTLWTDFAMFGSPERGRTLAGDVMSDYRVIRNLAEQRELLPQDTLNAHARSRKWLTRELQRRKQRKCVVVTHHAPSLRSVGRADRDDELVCAYASPLDEFVADSGAALWVHGHIHESADYHLGETRVVANPRGYPRTQERSNRSFDVGWTVEI